MPYEKGASEFWTRSVDDVQLDPVSQRACVFVCGCKYMKKSRFPPRENRNFFSTNQVFNISSRAK